MRVESCNDGPQESRQTEMDPGKLGNPHPCRTTREGLDGAPKAKGRKSQMTRGNGQPTPLEASHTGVSRDQGLRAPCAKEPPGRSRTTKEVGQRPHQNIQPRAPTNIHIPVGGGSRVNPSLHDHVPHGPKLSKPTASFLKISHGLAFLPLDVYILKREMSLKI